MLGSLLNLHALVQRLDGERTDAAKAAAIVADAYPDALSGLTARTCRPGLEEDIRFCARESVLDTVPRFARMVGAAAEILSPERRQDARGA